MTRDSSWVSSISIVTRNTGYIDHQYGAHILWDNLSAKRFWQRYYVTKLQYAFGRLINQQNINHQSLFRVRECKLGIRLLTQLIIVVWNILISKMQFAKNLTCTNEVLIFIFHLIIYLCFSIYLNIDLIFFILGYTSVLAFELNKWNFGHIFSESKDLLVNTSWG